MDVMDYEVKEKAERQKERLRAYAERLADMQQEKSGEKEEGTHMEKVTVEYEPKTERKPDALQEFAKRLAAAKKEKTEKKEEQ